MHKFGDQNEFAIWVDYFKDILKGDPVLEECPDTWGIGGKIYFWVKGKNIFEHIEDEQVYTYSGDISELVSYLSNNLVYHVINDPYPVNTKSSIAIEMSNESMIDELRDENMDNWHKFDWTGVDMDERRAINLWIWHHSWLADVSMFVIPETYFQKVDNTVEISWDGSRPFKTNTGVILKYNHRSGVEYVDLKLYRDVVSKFCLNFLDTFKERKYERMIENRAELQKALAVEL